MSQEAGAQETSNWLKAPEPGPKWASGLRIQGPGTPQRGREQAHSATMTSILEDFFLWKAMLYTQ